MIRLDPFYTNNRTCIIVLFDLRQPGAAEDLHALRAVLHGDSDIEALSEDCFALLILPSAARRLAA
jgi:hypothetical protein